MTAHNHQKRPCEMKLRKAFVVLANADHSPVSTPLRGVFHLE